MKTATLDPASDSCYTYLRDFNGEAMYITENPVGRVFGLFCSFPLDMEPYGQALIGRITWFDANRGWLGISVPELDGLAIRHLRLDRGSVEALVCADRQSTRERTAGETRLPVQKFTLVFGDPRQSWAAFAEGLPMGIGQAASRHDPHGRLPFELIAEQPELSGLVIDNLGETTSIRS